jgi:replicative DNA helicase
MTEKEHTQNETEGALLCQLLLGAEIPQGITGAVFDDSKNQAVFHAIQTLTLNGVKPKLVAVNQEIGRMGKNELVPASYIADLTNITASTANIDYYASKLLKSLETRQTRTLLKQALENLDKSEEAADVKNELIAELHKSSEPARQRIMAFTDWEAECKAYDPTKDFTPSLFGIRCPNGTLSVIGGRPGTGKTTAMINIAREALQETDRRVFFVNLEMTNKQIITNLALSCMYSETPSSQTLACEMSPQYEFYKLFREEATADKAFSTARRKALDCLKRFIDTDHRLFVYDGIGNTLDGILADIRAKTKEGDVVLLDYMQRIKTEEKVQRYLEIKIASNALLQLAVQNKLVVISGAQLNREKDDKSLATLSNFREGGDIEQDAHNAVALEYKTAYFTHVLKAREDESDKYTRFIWEKPYCYMQTVKSDETDKQFLAFIRGEKTGEAGEETESKESRKNPKKVRKRDPTKPMTADEWGNLPHY